MRIDISYRLVFVLEFFDGMLMMFVYAVLAGLFGERALDGYTPLGFLLVGVVANGALMTSLGCFAQAVRGVQGVGVLKALVASPTSLLVTLTLSSFYPLLRGGLDLLMWTGVAVWLGAPVADVHAGGVVATALLFLVAVLSMAGLGFLSAAFALVFKRGDPILWAFGAFSMLLSGVLYPTSSLPPMVERLAAWVPTTHALNGLRATILGGAGVGDVAPQLAALAAFAVVGLPLGVLALVRAIDYAREEGTLGHV